MGGLTIGMIICAVGVWQLDQESRALRMLRSEAEWI